MANLSAADAAIVVASLLCVFAAVLHSALKSKSKKGEADEYFLAGRSMPWTIIAASLFASNIGAEHFVGQAGAAASIGVAISLYEWTAAYLLVLLGWVFAPVYLKVELKTIPEYLERRFNKECRVLFVLFTMVAYVVTKIGATLYAGSILLEVIAGMTIWQSAPVIVIATAVYTIAGGLTAVMMTDAMQTLIFLFGGLIGMGFALNLVGGVFQMFDILDRADIGLDRFRHALRPINDRDVPWPGLLFGLPIVSLWYWCIDQEMAQRVLSASSLAQARTGTAAAALLKVIPAFITVIPGMVARTLFEQCTADVTGETFPDWCATDLRNAKEADKAYPLMVIREFPDGIRGIMVASFLAAMMSSLSSVFNSASTIFTYDIYERFFSKKDEPSGQKLVTVGRVVTLALTGFTLLWLPVVEHSSRGLYVVGQEAMTHTVPAVSAVFICGFFVPFANGIGALTGMIGGIAIGTLRAIPYFIFQDYCDERADASSQAQSFNSFNWLVCLNFNYFALVLFCLTLLLICGISWFTERPSLLSDLVMRKQKVTGDGIQLANLQYSALENERGQSPPTSTNNEDVERTSGQSKTIVRQESDPFWPRLGSVLNVDDGYLPHIFSIAAIAVVTTLIAVFH